MVYDRLGNEEQAMADYTHSLELAPRDAKVHYIRGLLHWKQGDTEKALSDIRLAADMGYTQAINLLKSKRLAT